MPLQQKYKRLLAITRLVWKKAHSRVTGSLTQKSNVQCTEQKIQSSKAPLIVREEKLVEFLIKQKKEALKSQRKLEQKEQLIIGYKRMQFGMLRLLSKVVFLRSQTIQLELGLQLTQELTPKQYFNKICKNLNAITFGELIYLFDYLFPKEYVQSQWKFSRDELIEEIHDAFEKYGSKSMRLILAVIFLFRMLWLILEGLRCCYISPLIRF